ncbi:MAG: SUMF1/EgtB/PvdO family nonheme iron enzyme [Anaerolineales bacterium]|nr:SUMF1/EgtB/PvdO family nonheme iron enzyme [Anaerolineales bacterium]
MKHSLSVWLFVLVLLLASCGPAPTAAPTATRPPAPVETLTPTPPPILVDERFEAGERMRWLDGSLLVYVPGGEFEMGSGEQVHPVRLNGFWIQQTEVTNRMYRDCVLAGACKAPASKADLPYTDDFVQGRPVTGVSWTQARSYCTWVQGRLPTEAEWERAARGSGQGPYPWGDKLPDCRRVNFSGCINNLSYAAQFPQGANDLGLLDMSGNAAEWVADWYDPGYYASSPVINPIGPAGGETRVIRGGSYLDAAGQISVTARSSAVPADTAADLGFRCAFSAPILYPPFCQLPAYKVSDPASSAVQAGECIDPDPIVERGKFCQGKVGFVNVDVPLNALISVTSAGVTCEPVGNFGDVTRFSCYGANNLPVNLTVCTGACYPDLANYIPEPVCDPGYAYQESAGACYYDPAPVLEGQDACPEGFVPVGLEPGQSVCLPLSAGLGCPVGQVLDPQLGGCRSAAGQVDCEVYGFNDPERALGCYQGCPQGYQYDEDTQCCRAVGDSRYPGCQPGYHYSQAEQSCLPGSGGLGGEGCTSIQLYTGDCVIRECGPYPDCGLGCYKDEDRKICIPPDQ